MNNAQGVETLGMGDFTLRKIHEEIVPRATGGGAGHIYAPYKITVPGYRADDCFVFISPRSYYSSSQDGNSGYDLRTPVYIDMGGEDIGIIRYKNMSNWDPGNRLWRDVHAYYGVECTVEVFKVYGG